MPYLELMKLSRDAAKRARETIAAEKARGGLGWGARARAAAEPALDEIRLLSDTIDRYREIEDKLDDRISRLRRLRQDGDHPPDVKRHQAAALQVEIDDLKAARRDWEQEVRGSVLSSPRPRPPRLQGSATHESRLQSRNGLARLGFGRSTVSVRDADKPASGGMNTVSPIASVARPETTPLDTVEEKAGIDDRMFVPMAGVPSEDGKGGRRAPEIRREPDSERPQYLIPGQAKQAENGDGPLDRVAGAVATAVSDLFEGPYGIPHKDLGSLVNQSKEDVYTPVLGFVRTFNEVLIEGGSQLGDVALRTAAAPVVGGIVAVGQTAIELGMTPTQARRLVRDLYIFGETGGAVAGMSPGTLVRPRMPKWGRAGRKPDLLIEEADSSGILDRHVGQLAPEQRDAVKRHLRQRYDEGQQVARKEIERRDLAGAEQAASAPNTIRRKLRDLVDFVQQHGSGRVNRGKPERVWFGRVGDARARELNKQLKQDYGLDLDLRGAVHRIDEDSIVHILRGHEDDHLPFTIADFELIPEIVEQGELLESAALTKRRGLPAVTYRKQIGDWYYVVEEVQKKGRILSVHTAYKSPAPKLKH